MTPTRVTAKTTPLSRAGVVQLDTTISRENDAFSKEMQKMSGIPQQWPDRKARIFPDKSGAWQLVRVLPLDAITTVAMDDVWIQIRTWTVGPDGLTEPERRIAELESKR